MQEKKKNVREQRMEDSEFRKLKDLKNTYDLALKCSAVTFAQRHQELIYSVVEYLLKPLHDNEFNQRVINLPKPDKKYPGYEDDKDQR